MDKFEAKQEFEHVAAETLLNLRRLSDLAFDIQMDGMSTSIIRQNVAKAEGLVQSALDGVLEATDE